jgi:hypothetical protein
VGHQGPLLGHDKDYNGSRFNVLVEWENGEIITEPLSVIAANNPVTCAVCAREHDLLDVKGWKRFRNLQGLQMVAFLSELNGLNLWATDIGNAYLEAKTSELLFIIASPEFGDLEGHMLQRAVRTLFLRSTLA